MRTLSLSVLLSVAVAAAPALAAPGGAVVLRDGVVVDTARSIAYAMHPQGGVEAIDLQKGVALWRSNAAERPLALAGDVLIAQARPGAQGELRIVALDVLHSGATGVEASLAMPEGIKADFAETLRHSYRASATSTAEGIVVSWQYEPRPSLSNRLRTLRSENEEEERERKMGREEGEENEEEREREEKLEASVRGVGGMTGNALFDLQGGRFLPLTPEKAQQLAGPRPILAASLSAPQAEIRRFSSVDGKYVLSSRRVARSSKANPYRWTISEAESGRELGTIEARHSMSPFLVSGSQLIHIAQPRLRVEGKTRTEQPLRLRGVDLATGTEIWSHEIRDVRFSGSAAE